MPEALATQEDRRRSRRITAAAIAATLLLPPAVAITPLVGDSTQEISEEQGEVEHPDHEVQAPHPR